MDASGHIDMAVLRDADDPEVFASAADGGWESLEGCLQNGRADVAALIEPRCDRTYVPCSQSPLAPLACQSVRLHKLLNVLLIAALCVISLQACGRPTEWTRCLPNDYLIYQIENSSCMILGGNGSESHFVLGAEVVVDVDRVSITSNRLVIVRYHHRDDADTAFLYCCIDTQIHDFVTESSIDAAESWFREHDTQHAFSQLKWIDPLDLPCVKNIYIVY